MKYTAILFVLLFGSLSVPAQLLHFSPEVAEGYTLLETAGNAYLITNCGEVVNEWDSAISQYHSKLLENGNLIYIDWISDNVKERAWDGSIVNEVSDSDDSINLDYEVIVLPNGNYLCVARKAWSLAQFDSIGYSSDAVGFPFQVDVVVELDRNSGEIVWLWNIADHVIQDKDPAMPNFGSVVNNPQRLDMAGISIYDWPEEFFMINGMDYNADLDQIVLSLRKAGEIVIIDHSTTTEEAAGSVGGNSGRGGDILYRWGNPKNYDRGDIEDQYLFYQHNPNWIQHGEHAGKIIIYNNGLERPNVSYYERYSTVPIIDPPMVGNMYLIANDEPFGPEIPDEDYSKVTTGHDFYSNYTSAAKVLENGNILVSVGGDMEIFELKPNGEEVWRYHLPGNPFLFRVEKYPNDYPGLAGQDLTPGNTIENPSSTVPCWLDTATDEPVFSEVFKIWVTPDNNMLHIIPDYSANYQYKLFDLSGREILAGKNQGALNRTLDFLHGGIYVVEVLDREAGMVQTAKVYLR